MENEFQQALTRAILRLLRPLVRILLRNGVAFGTFSDLAKKVYTDVAFEDFTLEGKKQTVSRVSILTGLTRKEVKRLHELEEPEAMTEEKRYNRAIRVVSAWVNDPRFTSSDKTPLPLPLEDGERSFTTLVKEFSGDVPVQAMLKELLASKTVEQNNETIYLIRHAYVPADDPIEMIHILGSDVQELIATIDHNLTHEPPELRYQRKVSSQQVSSETLQAFKKLSAREAQLLLERLDSWLNDHEIDPETEPEEKPASVSLGIYYYDNDPAE